MTQHLPEIVFGSLMLVAWIVMQWQRAQARKRMMAVPCPKCQHSKLKHQGANSVSYKCTNMESRRVRDGGFIVVRGYSCCCVLSRYEIDLNLEDRKTSVAS